MSRKKLSSLAIIFVCSITILYSQNLQKIYPLSDPLYRQITYLYLLSNKALPSTSGPYSQDELLLMLQRIDYEVLKTQNERELYNHIYDELSPPAKGDATFSYTINLDINTELYAHTNTTDFVSERDWDYGFNKRQPLARLSFETWPLDYFYSYFELSLMNNFGVLENKNTSLPNEQPNSLYGRSKLGTNIIMLAPNGVETIDLNFPYRSFVSFGSHNWSTQIGRDKLSWGAGKSGNLMISNNMPYQQFGRFSTYHDNFKYTLVSSFFTHPIINEYGPDDNNGANNQDMLGDGIKMFLAHRVEFRFLQDRLGLAVSEAMMYQSVTGSIDLRFLNPVGFYHNNYIRGNSNSLLAFELDYTLFRGLNLYAQLAIDEITFAEVTAPAADAKPDAFAYLAGIQGVAGIGKGFFTFSLEAIYADPFMYLREPFDRETAQFGVGYDVIVRVLSNSMENLRYFQGYPYGGDLMALDLRLGYEKIKRGKMQLGAFFMAHGIIGLDSLWALYTGNEPVVSTPSTENPFDPAQTGVVSYTLMPTFRGEYAITKNINVMLNIAVPIIWNKGNVEKPKVFDTQITLSLGYHL